MFRSFCKFSIGHSAMSLYSKNLSLFTFATKMRAGVTKNKKDSAGRRLGLKKYGGEEVRENEILIRQRGFKWKSGENVHFGKDQTLHASKEGKVSFTQDPWSRRRKVAVHIVEQEVPNRKFYPPKPFMYHPELYPELAKNNYTGPPLVINREIKEKLKAEAARKLKEHKDSIIEHRLATKFNPTRKLEDLRGRFLNAAYKAKTLGPHEYTSKFDIEPILEEMKSVAKKYLIPSFNLDKQNEIERMRREYIAEERGETIPAPRLPIEEQTYSENFRDRDSFSLLDYQTLVDTYHSHVENNSPVDLQELMIKMKEEGMIKPETNIKISDNYIPLEKDERIYSDERIAMKIEYEELLEKMNDFSEEEISSMLSQYDLSSKEELVEKINEEISNLDQEIMIKFLGIKQTQVESSSEGK